MLGKRSQTRNEYTLDDPIHISFLEIQINVQLQKAD